MSRWNSLRKYFFSTPVFKFYAFQALLKGKRLRSRRQMLAESRIAQAEICETRTLLAGIIVDSGGGADFTTIQAAVNSAAAGDVITVNNGTWNETVNLNLMGSAVGGSPGDLVIQAANSRQAIWNDAGAALIANGITGNFVISGFDLGTSSFTNVTGVVTLDDNLIDNVNGVNAVSANVTGTNEMGLHLLDNDFVTVNGGVTGAINIDADTSAGGSFDLVADSNDFTGLGSNGIRVGDASQVELTGGTLTARVTDNTFNGRTGFGTDIEFDMGGNNSNNYFASILIDGNLTNTGGAPTVVADALFINFDGVGTTILADISNNSFLHHDTGIFVDGESMQDGGVFNSRFDGNTISNTVREGLHIRPFSVPGGNTAVWNTVITGNTISNIDNDLSGGANGHNGIEIEADNTSNDDYIWNLDLASNTVSMATGSSGSPILVDADSTSNAIVNIERDIATNNTGTVKIDDPGSIVTMPSANAVTDSNEVRTISGFVFNDSNGDGDQAGEMAVGGVQVTLTGTQAIGGAVSLMTFTDINGNYAFPAVVQPDGSGYTLTVGTTPDLGFYTLQDAVADNLDSDVDQMNGQFNVAFVGSGVPIDVDAGLSATEVNATTPVNLSVDVNSGTEDATTVVTVTATSDSAVSGNQTVDLSVTGSNVTAGDFTLSNTTITILDGQTTGSVTFTIQDDNVIELTETATLTISNPSAGLELGSTVSQDVSIIDNDVPATLIVDTATDENDGDFSAGDLSLREAIILANSNADANTITFDVGLNGTPLVLTISGASENAAATGDLDIRTDITIIGNGADQTVIDAGGSGGLDDRIFDVGPGADFTLSGVTVTGGNSGFGHGAGIRVQSGITAEILSSVISNNTSSDNFGGGVSNEGTLSIVASTISGNTGFGGGGIWNGMNGSLTVSNSTFSGNLANLYGGGGIYNSSSGNAIVVNSTITGNTSSGTFPDGGGIADYGTFTLNNSIVAGNSSSTTPDLGGTIDTANHNLIGDAASSGGLTDGTNGNIVGNSGSGTLDINTILNTTLADNGGPTLTHALLTGSIAIDAGDDALATNAGLTTDQRGFPRFSGTVDIGAFEQLSETLLVDIATDENDGDFSAGDLSLREAIILANSNADANTITFDAALDGTDLLLTMGEMDITEDVTITGNGATSTIIDAQQNSRIFNITNTVTDITFDSLTLQNGQTNAFGADGGAINSRATGELSITNSTLSGNSTQGDYSYGGAIYASGRVTITNSTLSGNSTNGIRNGGGAINARGELTINNSTLSGNSTNGRDSNGGAIYASANVTITNSTLSGNSTQGYSSLGGAIRATGRVTITNSTLSGNSTQGESSFGGAIRASGRVSITNSTLSGNSTNAANSFGGAVTADNRVDVINSTLTNNHANAADSRGGAIATVSGDDLTIHNSIITGNTAGLSNPDFYVGSGATLTVLNSIIGDNSDTGLAEDQTGASGNLIGTTANPIDPMLGALADNGGPTLTHALLEGSLAIDAGDNSLAVDENMNPLTTDQRGEARFIGTVDIGAFEFQVDATPSLDGTAGDDAFNVSLDGAELVVTLNSAEVFRQALSLTDSLTLNGLDGDDSFTIDHSGGTVALPITIAGGAQTTTPGDNLVVTGGSFTDVVYDFTNANDGTIDYDGTVIVYTGLEPITDTSTATNRTFEFNGAVETVTLSDDTDAGDGESFIDSTLGESVVFTNPTGTLRVDLSTGSGVDTLNVEGLDSSFDANLTIVGDSDVGEEDQINFQTNTLDLDSGNLSVDVGAGNPDSTIESISVATNLTTTGNLTFETEVGIGADVTFTGADITFNSNVFDDADTTDREVDVVSTGTVTLTASVGMGGNGFADFDISATTLIIGSDSGNRVDIHVDDDADADGTLTLDANLELHNDFSIDIDDGNITPLDLTITGTINADAAASDRIMTIFTSGGGRIEFGSTIGTIETLANFNVRSNFGTPTIVLGGDLTVTEEGGINETVRLEGNVLLDNDVTINLGSKNLLVEGSINANTGAGGTALVINSTGSTQIEGAIGDTNTMTDFITTLTTNAGGTWGIQGNVTTTGNQSFGDDITLAADITLTSGEDITFNSNVVLDENSELDGVDIDFLAGVSGDSNLTLTSTGTVTFAAMTTSDFTGNLTVTSGTLQVLGEITDTTATVTIEDGATLAGTGSVLAMISVEDGGTVAPGLSPGQLDTGDVEFNTGAIFEVELNGAVAGVDYDQLIVNGSIDLDADSMGGAILALSTNLKYVPQQDDEFIVIDVVNAGSSVTGTFSGLAEGDTMTVDGIVFRISYQGGTGNDVTLTAVNTPPTVELTNTITSLPDNTDTSSRIKVADIVVTDDRISSFQTGMFHENNILIMNDPSGPATLFEFDTSGNLVSTTLDITEGRDLVFDSNGILHVFQGTSLFSYNPVTCEVTETFYPGLSTVGNLTYGAITAYGDYLFIADMQTANEGAPSGVVRVNINDLSDYERFNIGSPIDINVGLDGFLYTFTRGNATGADGTRVTKYDPETMLSLGSIDLFYVARAIAIDADGNIFAAHHEILRQHDPAGNIINELAVPGFGGEADLDISKDGSTLLFTSHGGEFIVFDHAMTSFSRYNSQPSNNVAFGTFVQTPVGSDTGNQLSLTGADADLFEIIGSELYLKAGVTLQFETNPALDVTVQVDDTAVGMTPDDTASLTISLTDAVPSTRIDISPSSLGYGIPGQDNAKGEGYILYSYLSVQERFAGAVIANGAEHFLAVRFINNQWQYANNDVWVDFTPTTGDRLIAAINFESGQVQMLQGSSGTVNGIDQGYIVSDLMITPNQWRNTYNAGEFGITGTFFTLEQIPPPRPNQVDIAPASLGYGIPGQDNAKGEGYILYSYLNVQERFTGAVIENGAENFLVVRFTNNQWQYAHNDVWVDFTPTTGDRLIATIDFDSSQVQMLQGSSGTVNGIDQGYVESDLMITPNQWRNTYNEGEFGITGTYFTLEQAPPRPNQINIAPTSLGYGIPGQDNANGEGYVLYSQQNVQERFAGAIIANGAKHFLAVRFINNQWQYAHNDVWVDFTPTTGDRLIAAINFSSSQVQMLQGSSGTVNGIDQGYVESDLMITPNQWRNSYNEGEFGITGTYFTVE